jgi:hypothetical protein
MAMKIIITESQYNELNKVDDIYDGLNPYYRRRINFINIKSNIDERIGYRTAKVLKHDPRGLVGHFNDIIHNVVWSTISDEWGGSEDDKLVGYVYEMMERIKMKYGEYIIEKLNNILEDEDNNN